MIRALALALGMAALAPSCGVSRCDHYVRPHIEAGGWWCGRWVEQYRDWEDPAGWDGAPHAPGSRRITRNLWVCHGPGPRDLHRLALEPKGW